MWSWTVPRDADAARFRQPLQPCRDVDAVAVYVVSIDDHVPKINPDAEGDAPVLGRLCVAVGHRALDLDGASDRIDDAREFDERPIASQLHGAAAVLFHLGVDELAAMGLQAGERPLLVRAHQARIARHIGGENGGQPAVDAFRGQSGAPEPQGPNRLSALGAHCTVKAFVWHSLLKRLPSAPKRLAGAGTGAGGRDPPFLAAHGLHILGPAQVDWPRWTHFVLGGLPAAVNPSIFVGAKTRVYETFAAAMCPIPAGVMLVMPEPEMLPLRLRGSERSRRGARGASGLYLLWSSSPAGSRSLSAATRKGC